MENQVVTSEVLREAIDQHLVDTYGIDPQDAEVHDIRNALSKTARGFAAQRLVTSRRNTVEQQRKQMAYISMEFLIGRLLGDMLINLNMYDAAEAAVASFGVNLTDVIADEPDPALGNGGLGRLAACYMESTATLGCPAIGYGLLYRNGLFAQGFSHGEQTETPEDWLELGNPWDLERIEIRHEIKLGGHVEETDGKSVWFNDYSVIAEAHDLPVIGWDSATGNTLRLWKSRPAEGLDFARFNAGDYVGATRPEILGNVLTRVLYPDDTSSEGKRLRLTQEYFLTSASIQDIIGRLLAEGRDLRELPDAFAIQLNDTHPTIAGPEIIRILVDDYDFTFAEAVSIATQTLSYTNHTLLKEALEEWPVDLMASLLPRHLQIIERLDAMQIEEFPGHGEDATIISNGAVHMGILAFVLAHKINGVSVLHSDLVANELFPTLNSMYPGRITNVTNGITPRRWLQTANPAFASLISETIGSGWQSDLYRLKELEQFAYDEGFQARFGETKRIAKQRVADWVARSQDINIDVNAVFDVQVKRIHEYKRQLLNILETVARWQAIKADPNAGWVPRVKIFGGKAAPGYVFAKQIIRFINDVASVINADPETNHLLKVVYPPNYNVSMAELLVPAADLSEQISTAGMEASGTGNMKFALNGALTIGTLDGANVEIREQVGPDNFFLFGLTASEVAARRAEPGQSRAAIEQSAVLPKVLAAIAEGQFSPEDPGRYNDLLSNIWENDWFLVAADFDAYHAEQGRVDEAYKTVREWQHSAILNTARMGYFSSDRAVTEYMQNIWSMM